jgi:hypothetical protein
MNLQFLNVDWRYTQTEVFRESNKIDCSGRTLFQVPNQFKITSECKIQGKFLSQLPRHFNFKAVSDGTSMLLYTSDAKEFIFKDAPPKLPSAQDVSPYNIAFYGDMQLKLLENQLTSDSFLGHIIQKATLNPDPQKGPEWERFTCSESPKSNPNLNIHSFVSNFWLHKEKGFLQSFDMEAKYKTKDNTDGVTISQYRAEVRDNVQPRPQDFQFELPVDTKQVLSFSSL